MNRSLLLASAFAGATALALVAVPAFAQSGIDLAWNDCAPGGQASKAFACDTNDGIDVLYGSVVVGTDMPQLNGMAAVIEIETSQPALSAWWDIGGCRPSSAISADFSFLGNMTCMDPWGGLAAGGVSYTPNYNGIPNRARIRPVCAIQNPTFIYGTEEYYMFKINLLNVNSTGAGACAGCTDAACIALNSIQVTQPLAAHDDRTFSNPITTNYAYWQSGAWYDCPFYSPTRKSTWGGVKSLYR